MTFRILVVEDESDYREVLVDYLAMKGFEADGIESIADYRSLNDPASYDLIVLDRTLPDGDGLSILEVHRQKSNIPIIIISGLGHLDDRIKGLEADADYYLVKPVKTPELLAIVNRYARRAKPGPSQNSTWMINPRQWELISPCGIAIKLTNLEMIFLSIFKNAVGVSISKDQIIRSLGQRPDVYDLRRLDTMISRLRHKAKEAGIEQLPLSTVYGVGYAYNALLVVLEESG